MNWTEEEFKTLIKGNKSIKVHEYGTKNKAQYAEANKFIESQISKSSSTSQKIIIKGELPGLNEIVKESKQHFAVYSKIKKHYTEMCAESVEGLPQINEKVDVSITWYTKDNKKDPDNIAAGIKYILDGFVQAKLIQGDGRRHIGSIAHSFKTDRENQRIEVILKKCEEVSG